MKKLSKKKKNIHYMATVEMRFSMGEGRYSVNWLLYLYSGKYFYIKLAGSVQYS